MACLDFYPTRNTHWSILHKNKQTNQTNRQTNKLSNYHNYSLRLLAVGRSSWIMLCTSHHTCNVGLPPASGLHSGYLQSEILQHIITCTSCLGHHMHHAPNDQTCLVPRILKMDPLLLSALLAPCHHQPPTCQIPKSSCLSCALAVP